MNPAHDEIVRLFDIHTKGFDAIERGLVGCLIEGLSKTSTGEECAWYTARKRLGIYTVRGRVKSRDRFRQKLVDAEIKTGCELTVDNFTDFIPDMVGTRIVCLHPDDLLPAAIELRSIFETSGIFHLPARDSAFKPLRVRMGRFTLLPLDQFKSAGFEIDQIHEAGYTSIHFVFRLGGGFAKRIDQETRDDYWKVCEALGNQPCFVEIQLRTILEEAWGEVDHVARYESELLRKDPDIISQLTALASYLQAGNHHISLIREAAKRKLETTKTAS